MRIRAIVLVTTLLAANWCRGAAPLADKVPADAFVYAAWAGADSLQPAYEKSHLKAIVDQSNFVDLAKQYIPMMVSVNGAKVTKDDVLQMLQILWRHPVAVYVAPGGTQVGSFYGGVVCDAGTDAAALEAVFRKMVPPSNEQQMTSVTVEGTIVSERTGNWADIPLVPLSGSADFNTSITQSSPALTVFANGISILKQWEEVFGQNESTKGAWTTVRDALGLPCIKSYSWTEGFDGADWLSSTLFATQGARTGLAAVAEPKTIDPVIASHVPASVNSLSVANFDVAGLFDTIHSAAASRPQTVSMMDKGVGALSMAIGRNLRRQILAPLGDQWVTYTADGRMVILNKTNDAHTAKDALVTLTYSLCNLGNSQLKNSPLGTLTADQTKIDGLTITTATVGQLSLAWAIDNDGLLYVSSTPEAVSAAAKVKETASDPAKNEKLAVALQRLNLSADKVANFSYSDLPVTFPVAYHGLGEMISKVREVVEKNGGTMPDIHWPAIEQIAPHLSPRAQRDLGG